LKLCKFDKEYYKRILYLETSSSNLANNLITNYPSIYEKIVDLTNVKTNILQSYPNDYGSTNPNPPSNQYPGYQIERSDLDYMEVNRAWEITTGISLETGLPVKIGISDIKVNSTDDDFNNGKVSYYEGVEFYPEDHGTNSGGIAAARGNNNYGSTGVCYDCKIENTLYDSWVIGYSRLVNLALQSKARVINMSWTALYDSPNGDPSTYDLNQAAINTLANDYRVILVASAGNESSYQTTTDWFCEGANSTQTGPKYTGMRYGFPASFDNVISVSSVNHNYSYTLPLTPGIQPVWNSFSPTFMNCYILKGAVGGVNGNDINNPVAALYNGWPENCGNGIISSQNGIAHPRHTTNPKVDILAPTWGTFQFAAFTSNNGQILYEGGGTSGSAPRVAGTAALMIAVNSCLYPNDVDAILKLTSHDVENLSFNQFYAGNIGAGALNTGSAVVFVDEMKKTTGNALIKDHIFNRFNFNLDKINNKLSIDNVTFKDDCRAEFTARNQIRALPGTRFAPNANGKVRLTINSSMDIGCPPIVYPPASRKSSNESKEEVRYKLILAPNPNNGSFNLYNINFENFESDTVLVKVLDLNGRSLFERNISKNDDTHFDIQNLKTGIYIVNVSSAKRSEDLKFIKK
jgi:hypothetical protein